MHTKNGVRNSNIWASLAVLLLVALFSAAIVVLLYVFYKQLASFVPFIFFMLCLLGILVSHLFIRKRMASLKKRDWLVLACSYGVAVLSFFLYIGGAFINIWLFLAMILLFVVNSHFAMDDFSLRLYNANTIYTMSLSATFSGLMWACFISDDWGTLLLALVAGLTFAAAGLIIAIVSTLLARPKFKQPECQDLSTNKTLEQ